MVMSARCCWISKAASWAPWWKRRCQRAISASDFGGEERGEEGRVGGKAVELGEGVVHLWVGLGASEADTAEVGNGGELRNSLVVLRMA